jgi:glycerol-3-phosphate cytidylyltransferase|tara:strand:- start:5549 stop:5974 length:426 start_codon:yes stop_codon:yes gene_type:complete
MVTGFTASTFDLLHAGHILMLREAKTVCDYLICALQTDPTIDRPEKNKPVQSYMERHIQLSAIKYVDEIVPYGTEEELVVLLNHLPIDIRIIGDDYYGKDFTGKDIVPVHFNKRQHNFSTSGLRRKVVNEDCCWLQGKKEK